jgi:hypothetical protein
LEDALQQVFNALFGSEGDLSETLRRHEPIQLCFHPELMSGAAAASWTKSLPIERGRPPGPKSEKIAESYLRNLGASLTETRDLAPSEEWEKAGVREALHFLSGLVDRRERF